VNGAPYHAEPTLSRLVSELADDAKLLLRQELALAKHELHEEARKTKVALVSLATGIGVAAIGGLLLIVMLVHLLHALTPLPLWACYGVVGGLAAIVGFALVYRGKKQIAQLDIIPQQTVETMKENVRWIREKTSSEKI
jgi:hypothetical protein